MSDPEDNPREGPQGANEAVTALEQRREPRSVTDTIPPTEEHVLELEDCICHFQAPNIAQIRDWLRPAIFGGTIALALVLLLFGFWRFGFGFLMLFIEAPLFYFLISGFFFGGVLFVKIRDSALEFRWKEGLALVLATLLFAVALWAMGMLWIWLAVTLLALALAFGLCFGLDRPVESSRQSALNETEVLFNKLRLGGMSEDEIRHFVCRFAGNQWEEFFEAMFGFEEKLEARDWWLRTQNGPARMKYLAWREPICRWLDARLAAREKASLQQPQTKPAETVQGVANTAEPRIEKATESVVQKAGEASQVDNQAAVYRLLDELQKPKPIARALLQEVEREKPPVERTSLSETMGSIIKIMLGQLIRFLLGAALLTGFVMWMHQNKLTDRLLEANNWDDVSKVLRADGSEPLKFEELPNFLTRLFAGYAPGMAGFMLLISALAPSWRTAILMPIAAAITLLGPRFGIPDIQPLSSAQVCMAVGGFLGLVALLLGGQRN